jgi:YVTN family beta-propeller protein
MMKAKIICGRIWLSGLILAAAVQTRAQNFDATTQIVGHGPGGLETPDNQLVTPAGKLVELRGTRPNALALSPDGKLLVTSGMRHVLIVLDPASGRILQRVRFPAAAQTLSSGAVNAGDLDANRSAKLSFTGLTFSPDGSRIYLSNVNGDIKVFAVDQQHHVTALKAIPLPPANAPERKSEIPAGITVSKDGRKLYVAMNLSDRLAELDADTGRVLRMWNVGVAPFGVVLERHKAYVSNWGGRRPDADNLTGPAGRGTLIRVDSRSIASEGSVSVIDLRGTNATEILTGLHACALALSPDGREVVVANAGSDTLSVIDTRTDKIVETVSARRNPADLFGAQPDALAFDRSGNRLFVCNGTQNAVAVFQFRQPFRRFGLFPAWRYEPGKTKMLGLIPVGWFPCDIAVDAERNALCVANIKDIAREKEPARLGHGLGFNTYEYRGSISLVPMPTAEQLRHDTQTVLDDFRYPLLRQAALPARPNQSPRPVPERVGEPSVFHHVVYIIKENRSYDQVLGDVAEGDGDPNLCVFGQRVTPNQHKLVRQFVLLDNTYCCSILSADGHQWTDSALANDYIERSFAGWPRSYGSDALAYSSAGFIWNDAIDHGKTVADFGERTTGYARWKNPARKGKPTFLDCYHDYIGGSNDIVYSCKAEVAALQPYVVTNTMGWNLDVPDQWRATQFIKDLKRYEAGDNLPDLLILWLPNDHTSATRPGSPTPDAQVADNDLAVGRVVDAISHSKYWKDTCIFAIEDDPQNGWDHVSGYRTTAYVASAYTRRHVVVHTQYNQTSLLRTMELMLALPPMNQMDATATPMFDCFTNTPDFAAFTAVTNQVPLDEMNPAPKKISDARLRRDALMSARFPLEKEDQCPENLFNRILWRDTKGPRSPYPKWATAGDATDTND